jgi:hypothetical protein
VQPSQCCGNTMLAESPVASDWAITAIDDGFPFKGKHYGIIFRARNPGADGLPALLQCGDASLFKVIQAAIVVEIACLCLYPRIGNDFVENARRFHINTLLSNRFGPYITQG